MANSDIRDHVLAAVLGALFACALLVMVIGFGDWMGWL